jgi:hypothetical protein
MKKNQQRSKHINHKGKHTIHKRKFMVKLNNHAIIINILLHRLTLLEKDCHKEINRKSRSY